MTLSYNPVRDRLHNTDSICVPPIQNDEKPAERDHRRRYVYMPAALVIGGILLFFLMW